MLTQLRPDRPECPDGPAQPEIAGGDDGRGGDQRVDGPVDHRDVSHGDAARGHSEGIHGVEGDVVERRLVVGVVGVVGICEGGGEILFS